MAGSKKWAWLWQEVIPGFTNGIETLFERPVAVAVDTASLDKVPDPRERVLFLLNQLEKVLRLTLSRPSEITGSPGVGANLPARSSPDPRSVLGERIKRIEIRGGRFPRDPALRLGADALRLTVPTNQQMADAAQVGGEIISDFRLFPGCRAEDLWEWIQCFLEPELQALLEQVHSDGFPKAQRHLSTQLTHLIATSSLGEEIRRTTLETLSSEGLELEVDWQSFIALRGEERLEALRRMETGHATQNPRYGDLFASLFRALDETGRADPPFLERFVQGVRTIRFVQTNQAHVELVRDGETLLVREGRHGLPGSEELLEVLGPVVSVPVPFDAAAESADEDFVEAWRRQLEEVLGQGVDLAVDPALLGSDTAQQFMSQELLVAVVGSLRQLMDRPGYAPSMRKDIKRVQVIPAEAEVGSGCTFHGGVLVVSCRVMQSGFSFLSPSEFMRSLDGALALKARARIEELEEERRSGWQNQLREAFGKNVELQVDWKGFLAHPSEGGNRLRVYEVVSSGVEPLLHAVEKAMARDARFKKAAKDQVKRIRVACAREPSEKGVSLEGTTLLSRCFPDPNLGGFSLPEELERGLHRHLAPPKGETRAAEKEDLPRAITAILEEEAPYDDLCEITSRKVEVAKELRPFSRNEDAVEVRVAYQYRRGEEVGHFTDLEFYRWLPDGELRCVFRRTIQRVCQLQGAHFSLKGQVETTGRASGLENTEIYVSLQELLSSKEGSGGCESEEEFVWREGRFVDKWPMIAGPHAKDEILDAIGLVRPLHSIIGHQLRTLTFRDGLAVTVEAFETKALFLLRDEGHGLKRIGSGEIVSPDPPPGHPLGRLVRSARPPLGDPYLLHGDRILDLDSLGLAVPLSCAYNGGRVVQLYRCEAGRLEHVLSYNLEHHWSDGNLNATMKPISRGEDRIPDLQIRGSLTRYSSGSGKPSETQFRRVFRWNGKRFTPSPPVTKGGRSRRGGTFQGVIQGGPSVEEILRAIYGAHMAVMADLDNPSKSVHVRRFGEGYAVLVVPKRQLFLLQERDEELSAVAGAALPDPSELDEDYSGAPSLRLARQAWPVSVSQEAVAVEYELELSGHVPERPWKGHARWLLLFLLRPGDPALRLILQAPLARRFRRSLATTLLNRPREVDRERFEAWRAELKPVRSSSREGYFTFRLASSGPRPDRVFLWNGLRYVDSASLQRYANQIGEELKRLDLWLEEDPKVPDDPELIVPDDFPAWIQFSLLPKLRDVPDTLCLPEVQGLAEMGIACLDDHSFGWLLRLLLDIRREIHPSRTTAQPAVWDWLDSERARPSQLLRDCVRRRGGKEE